MISLRKMLWILVALLGGCSRSGDPQAAIEQWNLTFAGYKQACEQGNMAACQATCQMSRSQQICTTVSTMMDPNDAAQRAWLQSCPGQVESQGDFACRALDVLRNNSAEAPIGTLPTATPPGQQAGLPVTHTQTPSPAVPTPSAAAPDPHQAREEANAAARAAGLIGTDTASHQNQAAGSLPKDIIRRVIGTHTGRIRQCYEQRLVATPDLIGRLTVTFTIATTGRVSAVKTEGSTLNDPPLERCVHTVFESMVFPAPTGGPVEVSYPFNFSKG